MSSPLKRWRRWAGCKVFVDVTRSMTESSRQEFKIPFGGMRHLIAAMILASPKSVTSYATLAHAILAYAILVAYYLNWRFDGSALTGLCPSLEHVMLHFADHINSIAAADPLVLNYGAFSYVQGVLVPGHSWANLRKALRLKRMDGGCMMFLI
uniref:Uncharacterized protein n=1 Tax=Coccidioides posadasii RMSCC 3488 TaxID=454284 RepID=A0A0J6HZM9_COCPO|nr:hypothetical protein CPAG_00798 [Coccidioides posadasii RMSCC 3488]